MVTVAYGEPVHHVMQFDPADPRYLYLMTSHQVRPQPWPGKVLGQADALVALPLPGAPSCPIPFACSPFISQHRCHLCQEACVCPIIVSSLGFPHGPHYDDSSGGFGSPLSWARASAPRWSGSKSLRAPCTPPAGTAWVQQMPTAAGAPLRHGEARGRGWAWEAAGEVPGPDLPPAPGAPCSRTVPTPAGRVSGPAPMRAPAAAPP